MKKNILNKRKLCLVIIMAGAMFACTAAAQTNPKDGYIITNQNDTIHGTIDYLTETKSEHNCKFRKNGETEFKNYSPAQLKAYRSNNDDFYYFSKDIKIEDKQEKLFAGYLVKGGMSLYHFLVLGKDYYLLEGENGETAQILDASQVGGMNSSQKVELRKNMAQISRVFKEHPQELHNFNEGSFNDKELSKIVVNYDNTYCKDLGDCVLYAQERGVNSQSIKVHVLAGVGAQYESYNLKDNLGENGQSGSTIAPSVHLGLNIYVPRFSKKFFLQAKAQVSYRSYTFDSFRNITSGETEKIRDKSIQADAMLGVAYRLVDPTVNKVVPFVRAGLDLNFWLSHKMDNNLTAEGSIHYYDLNKDVVLARLHAEGFYVGLGVDVPVGNHQLEITADYKNLNTKSASLKSNIIGVTASWVF